MKKEYVKPQNRVVILKDKLLQIEQGSGSDDPVAKEHFDYDSDGSDSSDDVWED
jgi:hypothetical protein